MLFVLDITNTIETKQKLLTRMTEITPFACFT